MDYKKNRKYFKPISYKLGIILILVGLFFWIGNVNAGIVILLAGVAHLAWQFYGRPSDAKLDELCKETGKKALQRGLAKMGLDEEQVNLIEPILVDGFYFEPISHKPNLVIQGRDGQWRSSNYEATVFYFSENQVHAFTHQFSLIDPDMVDSTDEYFYKDVVSVATASGSITQKDKKGNDIGITVECFKLTTSGGNSISCAVSDAAGAERSIQGMRQLLRDKKSA
ncbi:hypothetical protein [Gorillibacterium sp. CAU 1737]|uniref:hypothetical protein n=1 Tax=Gorillibacterium sp. CAU 1737 TaxID=3140362 RepID=UPI0032614C12